MSSNSIDEPSHLSDPLEDATPAQVEHTSIVERALRRQAVGRAAAAAPPPVLAEVGGELGLVLDHSSARSERIRALRTELLLLSESTREATMMALVSPSRGEGRSRLTAELAMAFSQLGRRTLLIDADLRRPRQHLFFRTDNSSGLTQTLATNAPVRHVGVAGLPELRILTSGPAAPNPLELLSHGRFERMLLAMRREYEYVLIDTPPVSEFADALIVATLTTRVLVVTRANITSHAATKGMLRRLASTRTHVLGAILNHF